MKISVFKIQGGFNHMKKILATFLMIAMMSVFIPLTAATANAQTSRYYKPRSTYQKHKKLIDIGVGAGVGAIIGALIGGKKGALIGTAAGAGGGALYTYVINPKTRKRVRVYRPY
jgi:osmotically inducible lipoprotein OsmB